MNKERANRLIQGLKELARKETHWHINELRVILALERAIARLQCDAILAEHLVFKGGFVLLKQFESQRFTRDADALAIGAPKAKLQDRVAKALSHDLEDGLWFGDIQVENLEEQGKYGALRFDAAFQIGEPEKRKLHKLSRVHIDIGFGDEIVAEIKKEWMPLLFPFEEPISWRIYPLEQIIAEKLETLFSRGSTSSRARDIYDLIHLLPRAENNGTLLQSIAKTFDNRNTPLPELFVEEAGSFDLTVLKAAWPGVRVLENKIPFEEAWRLLMNSLKEIDDLDFQRRG